MDIKENNASPVLRPTELQLHDSVSARTGTLWTAVAHIITGVIGAGVLSLAWATAELGWIGGPAALIAFAGVTLVSAFLLSDCYLFPDANNGPIRLNSYSQAVKVYLGKKNQIVCGVFVYISLIGVGVAYTIIFMSQIPNFHNMLWLSVVAAIMSFAYSSIGLGLAFDRIIEKRQIEGSVKGSPAENRGAKVWLVFQALGNIAFSYPFSIILLEIQVYSQPIFAAMERVLTDKYPQNKFITKSYGLSSQGVTVRVNPMRLCLRTMYVVIITGVSMLFPYFNEVLGVLGALAFWPLAVYFPVEMCILQKKIPVWTRQWILLRAFSLVCLLVSVLALVGSVYGLVGAKLR
ncbi:hypothetical protein Bca101_061473 [Brassica carinata]